MLNYSGWFEVDGFEYHFRLVVQLRLIHLLRLRLPRTTVYRYVVGYHIPAFREKRTLVNSFCSIQYSGWAGLVSNE